eukprot:12909079-Alexandrium_andersonii.AAC.1
MVQFVPKCVSADLGDVRRIKAVVGAFGRSPNALTIASIHLQVPESAQDASGRLKQFKATFAPSALRH